MQTTFPCAVPEIPVTDMAAALEYYKERLGFNIDWGGGESDISGVSRGHCRLFLTDPSFRGSRHSWVAVTWLNLNSKAEVDDQHREWHARGAKITSTPDSKPWKLYEFCVADLDENVFRVFYDFSRG